jgi:dienelactone hydrolase
MKFTTLILATSCAASAAFGAIKKEAIEYSAGDDKTVLRGYLVYDDAIKGKRPGVLVCPEWWGCNEYAAKRAEMLAELGFVAFAIDVYGKDNVTTDPAKAREWATAITLEQKRSRPLAAFELLRKNERVDASRIAAIGYCMGGTVALELARTGADVKAVVCFHTSNLMAANAEDNKNIKAKVLVCHGDSDAFVQQEQIEGFKQQMRDAGVDFQFVSYSGAVHSFSNPKAGDFGIEGVKHHEAADRRSWRHMLDLYDEVFTKQD